MDRSFPAPRTSVPTLEPVIRAWALSQERHRLKPGAQDEQFDETEAILQRTIPLSIRAVYEMTDGAEFFFGNLMMDPLLADSQKLCFARNSELLRSWGWGIPAELAVFGGNGSDSVYGIWLPKSERALPDSAVIEIGAPDEEMRFMALAGSSFARFATWVTGYCSLGDVPNRSAALDALGLPDEFRTDDPDNDALAAICDWADPDLPCCPPDPYNSPVSLDWLRRQFGAVE